MNTRRTWKQWILRSVTLYAIVPYVFIVTVFAVFQRSLMYHPTRSTQLKAADAGLTEAECTDVSITTVDGETLHGWHLRALGGDIGPLDAPADSESAGDTATQTTRPEQKRQLVIYFPGNAQNRRDRLADLKEVRNMGCDVLIFDYRGYGDSTGSPSEAAMTADARRVWEFAQAELGFAPNQIQLFGESLGGAVALSLWSGPESAWPQPKAVILCSTFASMPRMAAALYPWFPFQFLVRDRWNSLERIGRISAPVIQFHGTADELVPLEEARALSRAGKRVRFTEIPEGTHNDIPIQMLASVLK